MITQEKRSTMGCEVLQTTRQGSAARRPVLFRTEHAKVGQQLCTWHERVIAAGFDGIELVLGSCQPSSPSSPPEHHPRRLEIQTFSDVHVGALAAGCMSIDGPRAVEEVGILLSEAAKLRATCLNLTIPPVADASEEISFNRYQDALNFTYTLLHQIRGDAEATGVAVALEAGADRALLSPVELREIIDAANSWAIGVCIDVDRIARIGCPVDWIKTLRHRVHAIRLSDAQLFDAPSSAATERTPGTEAIIHALDEITYDRPVIVGTSGIPDGIAAQLAQIGSRPL